MTEYNLFTASPPNLYANPESALTLGTEFRVDTRCWVVQIRWFRGVDAGSGTRRGMIYRVNPGGVTGTLVYGPVDLPAGTAGAWAALDIPALELTPGTYRVAVWHPSPGLYVATGGYFSTGPGAVTVSRGPITIPNAADALGQRQGSYANGDAPAFPADTYEGGGYYSDVTVTDTDPNPAPQEGLVRVRERTTDGLWVERLATPKGWAPHGEWVEGVLKYRTETGWVEVPRSVP